MLSAPLAAILIMMPVVAPAMVCRAQPVVLQITLDETSCRIGTETAIRRETAGVVECLLSNPQLRIITLHPDGRFSYLDTDNDTLREGRCTAD